MVTSSARMPEVLAPEGGSAALETERGPVAAEPEGAGPTGASPGQQGPDKSPESFGTAATSQESSASPDGDSSPVTALAENEQPAEATLTAAAEATPTAAAEAEGEDGEPAKHNKYCHFCQHVKLRASAMLACEGKGCARRFCEHCLSTQLGEDTDRQRNPTLKPGGGWVCPVCRKKCCCAVKDCRGEHRHCKAYRYRRRRAAMAAHKQSPVPGQGSMHMGHAGLEMYGGRAGYAHGAPGMAPGMDGMSMGGMLMPDPRMNGHMGMGAMYVGKGGFLPGGVPTKAQAHAYVMHRMGMAQAGFRAEQQWAGRDGMGMPMHTSVATGMVGAGGVPRDGSMERHMHGDSYANGMGAMHMGMGMGIAQGGRDQGGMLPRGMMPHGSMHNGSFDPAVVGAMPRGAVPYSGSGGSGGGGYEEPGRYYARGVMPGAAGGARPAGQSSDDFQSGYDGIDGDAHGVGYGRYGGGAPGGARAHGREFATFGQSQQEFSSAPGHTDGGERAPSPRTEGGEAPQPAPLYRGGSSTSQQWAGAEANLRDLSLRSRSEDPGDFLADAPPGGGGYAAPGAHYPGGDFRAAPGAGYAAPGGAQARYVQGPPQRHTAGVPGAGHSRGAAPQHVSPGGGGGSGECGPARLRGAPPSPVQQRVQGREGSPGASVRRGGGGLDLRRNAMIAHAAGQSGGALGAEQLEASRDGLKRMNRTDSHEKLTANGTARVSGNQAIAYSKGRRHGASTDNLRYYTSGLTPTGSPFCSSNDLLKVASEHALDYASNDGSAPPLLHPGGAEDDGGMHHSDSFASLSNGMVDLSRLLDADPFSDQLLNVDDAGGPPGGFLGQGPVSDHGNDDSILGWIDS